MDAFAIASFVGGAGLPWLVLTPDEGLVPGAGMTPGELPMNAEFIADGADHYGLYQATLSVLNSTPYDVNETLVCFTKAFNDVAAGYWADDYIHSAAGARITGGCGFGDFCPTTSMFRNVMARWLVKLMYGPDYAPPPCTGIFEDVICESTPNADYIEQIYNDGVTTGFAGSALVLPRRRCQPRTDGGVHSARARGRGLCPTAV